MFEFMMIPVGIFGAVFSFIAMIHPSGGPVAILFLFTFIISIHLAMDAYDKFMGRNKL